MEKRGRRGGIKFGIKTGNTLKKCCYCTRRARDIVEDFAGEALNARKEKEEREQDDSWSSSSSPSPNKENSDQKPEAQMIHLFTNVAAPVNKQRLGKMIKLGKDDMPLKKIMRGTCLKVAGNPVRRIVAWTRSHRGTSMCGRWDLLGNKKRTRCHMKEVMKKIERRTADSAIDEVMNKFSTYDPIKAAAVYY